MATNKEEEEKFLILLKYFVRMKNGGIFFFFEKKEFFFQNRNSILEFRENDGSCRTHKKPKNRGCFKLDRTSSSKKYSQKNKTPERAEFFSSPSFENRAQSEFELLKFRPLSLIRALCVHFINWAHSDLRALYVQAQSLDWKLVFQYVGSQEKLLLAFWTWATWVYNSLQALLL